MADKLTLTDLSNLTNQASAVATINANNDDVETAMDNTLSRDGTAPNAMEAELDMNDNQIINVPTCTQNQHAANKLYVDDQFALFEAEVQQDAEDAANSAAEALASASAASTSAATAGAYATDAADSAAAAEAALDDFQNYYLGAFTSDPSLDNDGGPLTDGDLYFNTISNELRIYHTGIWYAVPQQYLTDLLDVNLSSPADLDVLQYNTSSSNWINRTITGAGIQPLDADLTSWAAITRAANFDTFVTTPTSANLGALVTDDLFLLSDIELGAIAGLTSAADKGIYFTGSGTAALFDLSSNMRTFLTTPSSANLGTLISDDLFLLSDVELGAIAGLTSAADKLPYFTGSGTAALADLSANMRTFMTTPSSANLATLVTDDAFSLSDAELGALAGLTSAADKLPYFTGSGTAALADLSSAMRTFLTTSSSANFKSVITDETGSGGALVFATGPTISGIILTGSPTAAGSTWTDLGSVTTIDINGGTVDGTVIGGASAAAATVTTLAVTQTLALQGDISPTSFSTTQNDYNPTNLSTSAVLRLTATAASNITGLQGGADGRIVILHNIGSFNITLKDEDTGSSAANRFALVADLLLQPDQVAMLQYDSTSSRWRAISGGGGAFTYASTAPASATPGDRWVDSNSLIEYTYLNDGNSSQWVELGPGNTSTLPLGSAGFEVINGTLAASAASSALTIALKDSNGNDPSPGSPVWIPFRNPTETSGTISWLGVTSATSLVISSGSTMGVTSSTAFRIWVVGFNDSGTFRLGAINCSTSTRIYPLTSWAVASSTAEGGAGAADSAGTFYTGTAVTSKPFMILGFLEWTSSGLTAGTWTTSNLGRIQPFGPGVHLPGAMVQRVYTEAAPSDTTSSATYVVSSVTSTITLTSAANLVEASFKGDTDNSASGRNINVKISRGNTANTNMIGSDGTNYNAGARQISVINGQVLDKPNTASAQIYALQIRSALGGSVAFSGGDTVIMELIEVMG